MRKLVLLLAFVAGCVTGGERQDEGRERAQDALFTEDPPPGLKNIAALLECIARKNT